MKVIRQMNSVLFESSFSFNQKAKLSNFPFNTCNLISLIHSELVGIYPQVIDFACDSKRLVDFHNDTSLQKSVYV